MQPDDPPIVSPDGRYAFAHSEIERRNNEWLPFAYLAETRRGKRLFELGTSHLASIEWVGPTRFIITVGHERDPGCVVSVHGDAHEGRFVLGDGSRRGPLKDLKRILDQWFENRLALPRRGPVRSPAVPAEPASPVPPERAGPGFATLLIVLAIIAAFAVTFQAG